MATAGGLEIHQQIAHGAHAELADAYEAGLADDNAFAVPSLASVPRAERDPRAVVAMERPRSEPNRTAVPFIAMAIVALLVAGVASALVRGNASEVTPLAMVRASASATTDVHTTQMGIDISGGSGLFKNFSETGAFDFDSRRLRVQVDMAQFGVRGLGKVDAIADYGNGLTEYVRLPSQIVDRAGGKPWIKVDLQALFKQMGIDTNLGALLQGGSSDPTQGLAMVRGAENVVKIGTEQVRGVDTTHYHLDINFQKAVADAPPAVRAAIQQFADEHTVPTSPADVWLDSDGRVRRIQQKIDFSDLRLPPSLGSQVQGLGTPTVTAEFYGFGNPVDTELPPADQVLDFNQLPR